MGSERFERRAYSLLVIWGMKFRYGVRFLFCASNEFEQGSMTLEGPRYSSGYDTKGIVGRTFLSLQSRILHSSPASNRINRLPAQRR